MRFVLVAFIVAGCTAEDVRPALRSRSTRSANSLANDVNSLKLSTSGKSIHLAGAGVTTPKTPSMHWALLANFLYFLSLGMNAINMAFLVSEVTDGTRTPSPASVSLSVCSTSNIALRYESSLA